LTISNLLIMWIYFEYREAWWSNDIYFGHFKHCKYCQILNWLIKDNYFLRCFPFYRIQLLEILTLTIIKFNIVTHLLFYFTHAKEYSIWTLKLRSCRKVVCLLLKILCFRQITRLNYWFKAKSIYLPLFIW
jgi:hypothetical protein